MPPGNKSFIDDNCIVIPIYRLAAKVASLIFFLFLFINTTASFAQADTCEIILQPFSFSATTFKEADRNIKGVAAYSKSTNADLSRELKGELLIEANGVYWPVLIDTKFDGAVTLDSADYKAISTFFKHNFERKSSYYFIPGKDISKWSKCKAGESIWTNLAATRNSEKGYDIVYSIYVPAKPGKKDSQYPLSEIKVNGKSVSQKGKNEKRVLVAGEIFTDTISVKDDVAKIEIACKALGKSFKFMYINKVKGENLSRVNLEKVYFDSQPGSTISSGNYFFESNRLYSFPLEPLYEYQASLTFTVSNGAECSIGKGQKFTVQPVVEELNTGKADTLELRTLDYNGTLTYRCLFDIPASKTVVKFNVKSNIICKNDKEINQGHVGNFSMLIFKKD